MKNINSFIELCQKNDITSLCLESNREAFFEHIVPAIFNKKKVFNEIIFNKILIKHFYNQPVCKIKANTGLIEQLDQFKELFENTVDDDIYQQLSEKSLVYIFRNTFTKKSKTIEKIKHKFYNSLKEACMSEDRPDLVVNYLENNDIEIQTLQQSIDLIKKVKKNEKWLCVLKIIFEKNAVNHDYKNILNHLELMDFVNNHDNTALLSLLVNNMRKNNEDMLNIIGAFSMAHVAIGLNKNQFTMIKYMCELTGIDLLEYEGKVYDFLICNTKTTTIYELLNESSGMGMTKFTHTPFDDALCVLLSKMKLEKDLVDSGRESVPFVRL